MFKKLLFFCLCFLVMNIANAEIQQFTNSFDNTMHIYVISEKTKSQFPRFFVFRKIISPESTKYYLSIQNNNIMSKYFSNIENIKLKINDEQLYVSPTKISPLSDRTNQATILLDDSLIGDLQNIQKMVLQIPVFMEEFSRVESYYYLEVPQSLISEWKQVIAME